MRFTIFHEMDRLASMAMKTPPTTIPVVDVQGRQTDSLQDEIERCNLALRDQEEATKLLKDINDRLEQRIQDQSTRITSYQETLNHNGYAVARCTSLESQVKKLEADLKTEISNRDHFRQLVAQQDAFITEAKRQITEFKNKKEAELKAKVGEAEHLARQVLKLKEQNDKYVGSEYTDLKAVNDQLNGQTANLLEENRKFTEQTTRLIEEKRLLDEQLLAEKKFSLALDDKLQKRDDELAHERSVAAERWQMIETLSNAMKLFKQMPCITWRQQGKLIRETQATVDALQADVEQMRKSARK